MKGTIALALAFIFYPFVFSNAFCLDIGVALLLAAISASAWNIVGGYAGQVSVGHCMFFGAGAYLPLLVYHHWQLPPMVGVPLGIIVSLALAVIVGMPTFRLTGHYFSMATIAVAELIRLVIGTWDFAGAAIGLQGPAGGGGTGLTYILYGGIIVIIARFEPGGLHEMWHRIAPRFRKRNAA